MEYKDYYQILRIPQDASQEQIRNAYRYLISFFHPDKFVEDPERQQFFQELTKDLNEAHKILSNTASRLRYDQKRSGSVSSAKLTQLKRELNEAQANLHKAQNEIAQLRARVSSREDELSDAREQLANLRQVAAQYRSTTQAWQSKAEEHEKEASLWEASELVYQEQLRNSQAQIDTLQAELDRALDGQSDADRKVRRQQVFLGVSWLALIVLFLLGALDVVGSLTPDQAVTAPPVPLVISKPFAMELRSVPGGEFAMGSKPSRDRPASASEEPQHMVELADFYISRHEVTNAQYAYFVAGTGWRAPSHWSNGTVPVGKQDHPVVHVAWADAVAFTEWLSAETDMTFRLPTEAEWEMACRGTERQIYPWLQGDPSAEHSNYGSTVGDTTQVGAFSPQGDSPFGLADMAGNVWEWTSSPYRSYPYNADIDQEMRDDLHVERVLRGGSFYSSEDLARCAARISYDSINSTDSIGFRVVASASSP
jgi:formylglycine-generating enzyme required for sulfatase activity